MSPLVRRVLGYVASIIAAVVLVACLTLATGTGQRGLLGLAAQIGSAPGSMIAIQGFDGSLFSSGRIARITLSDTDGPWLKIENLEYSWRPSALLSGTLEVANVEAAKVLIERVPTSLAAPQPKQSKPSWQLPLGIRLSKAAVGEIILSTNLIGVPARLTATASLLATGMHSDIKSAIDIRRIDGHDGTLSATLSYNAATGAIEADVSAAEPAGGLIATILESPGLPPLRATIVGRGKTSDIQLGLTLESADKVFTIGKGRFWQEASKQQFSASLDGYLTTALPKHLRDVFAGRTRAQVSASIHQDGSLQIATASLRSDALNIEAHGQVNAAHSTAHGEAILTLGTNDGRAIQLPLRGQSPPSIVRANAKLVLSNKTAKRPLTLIASLQGLSSTAHGTLEHVQLTASALQSSGHNWRALESIAIDVAATGINATDKRVHDIVASDLKLRLRGHSDQLSFVIDEFSGTTASVKIAGKGTLNGDRFDGHIEGTVPKLAALSALANRPISGRAKLVWKGHWAFSDSSAKVDINLSLLDPRVGIRQLDAVLSGENLIRATLLKDLHRGLRLEDVNLAGVGLEGKADLKLVDGQPTGGLQLTVKDLQQLDPALRGSLVANGQVASKEGALSIKLDVIGNALHLRGKPVKRFAMQMQAVNSPNKLSGDVKLQSRIDGTSATGNVRVSHTPQSGFKLDGIALNFGPNQLRGWLQFGGHNDFDGDLVLDAPTLKAFSILVGKPISGKATARLTPTEKSKPPGFKFTARADSLVVDTMSISRITANAEVRDPLVKPFGFGRIRLADGRIGERTIPELTLAIDAKRGAPLAFGLNGRSGAETLSVGGTVDHTSSGTTIALQRARLASSRVVAKLAEPTMIQFMNGNLKFSRLRLGVGSGHITIMANSGKTLKIAANLSKLPMSLVDMIAPDTGAGGELNGRLTVSGTAPKPIVKYNLALVGGTTAATRNAGIAPLAVSANGVLKNNILTVQAKAFGANGLTATTKGTVHLKPEPVLNIQTKGQLPLKLLNALLAERGTRGSGFLKADVAVTGPTSNPKLIGTATISNGTIQDPGAGIQLTNLQMRARITKSQLTVDRLEAAALPGGRIAATGSVLFDGQAGFPISAQLRADGLKIRNNQTLNGSLNGRLTVSGALKRELRIGGNVSVQRFDIQIPERLPRTVRELDVSHVNVSKEKRAKLGIKDKPTRQAATTPIRLNLTIKSDGQIFIRGRGLDAQLGGGLTLVGTTINPIAEGEFHMIRGRLAIVGRRLVFNRGAIGFTGSLDPILDFAADTDADGTIITTIVSGRASDPKVAFTSSPQLPEDELLARLLFNKSLSKLSPLQIAQLASEVDKIGGLSSGPGIMDQLRKSVGIDVLDVSTDAKGNAAVTAGKYVNPNTYIGVQQNTGTNTSRVIIDLDITKNIKARGETGSDGNSKLGVGVEWDY